jgi:signal peptidase I
VGTFANYRLDDDAYFVMGDNRAQSVDSRAFGEIDRRLILGKVVYTLW